MDSFWHYCFIDPLNLLRTVTSEANWRQTSTSGSGQVFRMTTKSYNCHSWFDCKI